MSKSKIRLFFAILSLCLILSGLALIPASADTFFDRLFSDGGTTTAYQDYRFTGITLGDLLSPLEFNTEYDCSFSSFVFSSLTSSERGYVNQTIYIQKIHLQSNGVGLALYDTDHELLTNLTTDGLLSAVVTGLIFNYPTTVSTPPGIVPSFSGTIFGVGSNVVTFVMSNPLCLIGVSLFVAVAAFGAIRRLITGV